MVEHLPGIFCDNHYMYLYRPAEKSDFPIIHRLQDVPFRDNVYANYLPRYEQFEKQTLENIAAGTEVYYMFEKDGAGWKK